MSEDWASVAETVKHRRTTLGLSQRRAADRGGLSPTTWGSLEKHHQRIDDLSRPRFCRALGWTPDSIDRILRGKEPQLDEDAPEPVSIEEQITEIRDQLAELRALVSSLTNELRQQAP